MKRKNILALTYWSYRDALVQTYTLPYIRIIRKYIPASSLIYLVTFEQKNLRVSNEDKKRIKEELKREGIIWIYFLYSSFGVGAIIQRFAQLLKLLFICFWVRIDYIHAWCTPAGAIGYCLSVFTGKTLVLDSFEPHAEPSVETGVWKANGLAFRLLFYLERKQAQRAKYIIGTSSFVTDYAKEKWNLEFKNFSIKPALVDLNEFNYSDKKNPDLLKKYGLEYKKVCVYAGKTGGIYLEKEIFEFIKVCHNYWGDEFRFLMITNTPRSSIEKLCDEVQLNKKIVISCYIDHKEIPMYMGMGDFALNPVKMVESKKYCTSIKDGEYWALGLPIAITNSIAEDVKNIYEADAGAIIEALNEPAFLKTIGKIDQLLKDYSQQELYDKIRPLAEKYRNYRIAEKIYMNLYSQLGPKQQEYVDLCPPL